MKMRPPLNVSFHHDLRLIVWRPRGILREEQVNQIVEFLEKEEDRAEKPINPFTDTSKLDAVDLDPQFIFRVSLHRRLVYAGRPPGEIGFLCHERCRGAPCEDPRPHDRSLATRMRHV